MTRETRNPLLKNLMEQCPFPHPVRDLHVAETHISRILLTGDYVYKFKKPVDLGFVDFTTLEKRKHFCDEELRLNRRYNDELYLDVVAITGTVESPTLDGEGKPFEYAVKMKQFPEETLLARVIERDELRPRHFDQLAIDIARFHERFAIAAPDSSFGSPETVLKPIDENFRQLFDAITDDADLRSRLDALECWSKEEFSRLTPALQQRKRGGFVRECHGDMHLGNMILRNDRIILFDCVEFNESFRWVDLISEVAFCVMDLQYRGHGEFAHRFLNRYLEETGDYRGMDLFRFYLTYRALVRAKVAGIRLHQDGLTTEESEQIRQECAGYVSLAERFIKKHQQTLSITHGFSGSGKTWGTQTIVDQEGAIRIRSDVERKRLFGLRPEEKSDSVIGDDFYSAEATERTYRVLREEAASLIDAGYSVIVDATFLDQHRRTQFRQLAENLGVPFHILSFQASDDVLRERIRERHAEGRDSSEADLAVLEHQWRTAEPLTEEETPYVRLQAPPKG
ncbi:MAG: hypothetical protein CMJ46_07210 [Planctomyces sp.]|nr:hypothetical protein [Planctomyces sp.]